MNDVIVIGGNHHNTLGVIRALGRKRLQPTLILISSEKKPFVKYSKYIKRTIQISDNEQITDTLLDQCGEDESKPVVICCSDGSIGAIDDNRNRLSQYFHLPGSEEQGRIATMMSKKRMAELALSVGLKVPKTSYIVNSANELPQIELPCIIKPLESRKGSKSDIAICRTLEELKSYADGHTIQDYQIQSFIDKDFEYQLIGCSTKEDIIIPGVSKILRPCKGSNTSFLHYTPLPDDFCEIEKCKVFVRSTNYYGLFSLEFLRDKRGDDFFMEINFRNDGNAISVTSAGVNLPYIWYLSCKGKDYQAEKNNTIIPQYVMPDMAELKLLLTRQISVLQYLGDLFKTNCFMEFDKHDIKPFLRMITQRIR